MTLIFRTEYLSPDPGWFFLIKLIPEINLLHKIKSYFTLNQNLVSSMGEKARWYF